MNTETTINADDWKTGTDALALCMICGGEYATGTRECPDCHVSLSVVRRCPNCHRVVSAQHSKCVYCRSSFTHELPKDAFPEDLPALDKQRSMGAGLRRFRAAAVSIGTFVFVFCLGMVFLRQINKPPAFPVHVVAKSHVLHSAELRRAPSYSSSVVGKVVSGASVNLTGFRENDQGRWMTVDWNNTVAYLPVSDLAVPQPVEASDGANALKFYLLGMEPDSVDEAVKAVDSYAQAFPKNPHGEELKWVLAERIRSLSQHGGPQGTALRRQANQLYQLLAESNGTYAGKAHDALNRVPTSTEPQSRAHVSVRKTDSLEIIGGSGTEVSTTQSAPHEVLVLTQAEVIVRAGKLSQATEGAVVAGRVALQVRANGIMAIPAGAPCQLTVVSAGQSGGTLGVKLTSIEVDHHVYAVKSQAINIPSSGGSERALNFRLSAPMVIER
jgi:hypothetical protein